MGCSHAPGLRAETGRGRSEKSIAKRLTTFPLSSRPRRRRLFSEKKGQPIGAIVLIDPTFALAGDLSFAHAPLDERWLDPEALRDNRRIDLNGAFSNSIIAIARTAPLLRRQSANFAVSPFISIMFRLRQRGSPEPPVVAEWDRIGPERLSETGEEHGCETNRYAGFGH
jgi:hypothetical protein